MWISMLVLLQTSSSKLGKRREWHCLLLRVLSMLRLMHPHNIHIRILSQRLNPMHSLFRSHINNPHTCSPLRTILLNVINRTVHPVRLLRTAEDKIYRSCLPICDRRRKTRPNHSTCHLPTEVRLIWELFSAMLLDSRIRVMAILPNNTTSSHRTTSFPHVHRCNLTPTPQVCHLTPEVLGWELLHRVRRRMYRVSWISLRSGNNSHEWGMRFSWLSTRSLRREIRHVADPAVHDNEKTYLMYMRALNVA